MTRKERERFMASAEENETEKKKGSPLIKVVILVVILAVLGGGGFFAYSKFFHKPAKTAGHEAKPVEKVMCDMDTFLVNLADSGGRRYLKTTMKLELTNPLALPEIEKRNPEIRDAILMILASKEFEDIASSEGKASLKQEIMMEMNRILKQGQVTEVYYTDFIVQ
jgi:flagellar FliL protein